MTAASPGWWDDRTDRTDRTPFPLFTALNVWRKRFR